MAGAETLPLFARRGLWLVAAGAALTGIWLAPVAAFVAAQRHEGWVWILAAAGWITFAGGVVGWSRLASVQPGYALWMATQALLLGVLAFVLSEVATVFVSIPQRVCGPGDPNGPPGITWLVPALVYYAIGYAGFARMRWIRVAWPLAVAAAVFAVLVVGLIGTTGSGCGD